jgi:dUTP pyrophosphatase
MKKINIKFKRAHKDAITPSYAYFSDAGLDLYSVENYHLKPGENHAYSTGIALELPVGYAAIIMEKSGLALKRQISVLGGVNDAGYRGEIKVILQNNSRHIQKFKAGDKLAQLLIQKVETANLIEVNELSESERGTGSFGSSGKK